MVESLSRNQRPEGLSDEQYELYLKIAFETDIIFWSRSLLDSIGRETQTLGTLRGYVAKWIRENVQNQEDIEEYVQVLDTRIQENQTPECPNCNTMGRVGPSTLGGEGCDWYCYECCHTF